MRVRLFVVEGGQREAEACTVIEGSDGMPEESCCRQRQGRLREQGLG